MREGRILIDGLDIFFLLIQVCDVIFGFGFGICVQNQVLGQRKKERRRKLEGK